MSFIFTVKDSGIGIQQDRMDRLFKSFSQVDSSTNRKYGGTGLGLAISKNLTEAMGGNISVQSTYGEGTTFQFSILAEAADIEESRNRINNNNDLNITFNNKDFKILVADDNAVNRQLLAHYLAKVGLKCELAVDGAEVIEKCEQGRFDLIFMDVNMPKVSGVEATAHIRKNLPLPTQPKIAAVTANAMDGDKEACLKQGFDYYITKPIQLQILTNLLTQFITPSYKPKQQNNQNLDSKNLYAKLLKNFDNDTAIMNEIVNMLVQDYDNYINAIQSAYQQNNYENFYKAMHKFKGSISSFPFENLSSLADQLEKLGKDKKTAEIKKLMPQFMAEAKACYQTLTQFKGAA